MKKSVLLIDLDSLIPNLALHKIQHTSLQPNSPVNPGLILCFVLYLSYGIII